LVFRRVQEIRRAILSCNASIFEGVEGVEGKDETYEGLKGGKQTVI
jgi:hypothetical protein